MADDANKVIVLPTKLYEVPLLDSGEVVRVKPTSPFARALILQEAFRLHPDPDPKDFERPLENAAREGAVEPVDLNPDYVKARNAAQDARTNYVYNATIKQGVVVDTPEGREATMARYALELARLKKSATIPDEWDEWLVVVLLCIVRSAADVIRIGNAANEALTEVDILAGVRMFRVPLQRIGLGGDYPAEIPLGSARSRQQATSGAQHAGRRNGSGQAVRLGSVLEREQG